MLLLQWVRQYQNWSPPSPLHGLLAPPPPPSPSFMDYPQALKLQFCSTISSKLRVYREGRLGVCVVVYVLCVLELEVDVYMCVGCNM